MSFEERLVELRKIKDVTQEDVAYFIGVTRPAYTAYESGRRQPDYEILQKLADYFNVTTDYLLGRSDIAYQDDSNKPSEIDEHDNLQPTPPERIRKFYKKVGELSSESLALLEEQTDHLLRLEREVLERKRAERNSKQKNVDK